ncbi:hypothetical protein [Peribacillus muralis]
MATKIPSSCSRKWNGKEGNEIPAGNACLRETPDLKAEEAHGPPAES